MLDKIMKIFSSGDEPKEFQRTGFVSPKSEVVKDSVPERYLDIWEEGEMNFCFPENLPDSYEDDPILDYSLLFSRMQDCIFPFTENNSLLYRDWDNEFSVCGVIAAIFRFQDFPPFS